MSIITTPFERRENSIVARPQNQEGTVPLFEIGDCLLSVNLTMERAEAAIRRAYAMGRADERRQTAAVLRGLLGG